MNNTFEIRAHKIACEVEKNGNWLLFEPNVLNQDVLNVLKQNHNMVAIPYEGYTLVWSEDLSEEHRKEILKMAKDEIAEQDARSKRYPYVEWAECSDR